MTKISNSTLILNFGKLLIQIYIEILNSHSISCIHLLHFIFMSGDQLYVIYQNVRDKIMRLGNSTRNRWSIFSSGPSMTIPQFCQKMEVYNYPLNTRTVKNLWKAAGISNNKMTIQEFTQFLKVDPSVFENNTDSIIRNKNSTVSRPNLGRGTFQNLPKNNDESKSSPSFSSDIISVLDKNMKNFVSKLLENDPQSTGFISHATFFLVCSAFGNFSNIPKLIQIYDPLMTGSFCYFTLLSDICTHSPTLSVLSSQNSIIKGEQIPQSTLYSQDQSSFQEISSNNNYSMNDETNDTFQSLSNTNDSCLSNFSNNSNINNYSNININSNFSNNSNINNNSNLNSKLDACDNQASLNDSYNNYLLDNDQNKQIQTRCSGRSSSSKARTNLDPIIFGRYFSHSSDNSSGTHSGGRRALDPAIFGQKPSMEIPEQIQLSADDFPNAEHVYGLTIYQLMGEIEKRVSQFSRSTRICFNQWKGVNNYLTATELRNGLAKDCNVIYPLEDLEAIVQRYGGKLSLGTFVKLIGDGRIANENSQTIQGVQQMTADEAA